MAKKSLNDKLLDRLRDGRRVDVEASPIACMFDIAGPAYEVIAGASEMFMESRTTASRDAALNAAREAAKAVLAHIDRAIEMYEKQKGQRDAAPSG